MITEQKKTLDTNGLWLNLEGKRICYRPWTNFEVNDPNGDVSICPDRSTGVLGNINNQSINEIWNGEKYQQIRKQMYSDGADKTCGSHCLLLNGMKNYQSFSWFKDIDINSPCYKNALLNENEIRNGNTVISSFPRYMRFTISYQCNYRCYHCYQVKIREKNRRLPESFISDMKKYIKYYQFMFIFGGEPTLFPEFADLIKIGSINPYVRYGIISNGSLIHKHFSEIEKVNWAFIAISLDAATNDTYELLRKSKNWEKVNQNLRILSKLKKNKDFVFSMSMTLNSKNCHEIYDFVIFANNLNAIPQINLVSNFDNSFRFEYKYRFFSKKMRENILEQIERVSKEFPDILNETGLNVLKTHIMSDNILNHIMNYSINRIGSYIMIKKMINSRIYSVMRSKIIN